MRAAFIINILALFTSASASAYTGVQILENGYVTENPTFPYIAHGYLFDVTPGDNDMPWLRQYASSHGIFDAVDMTAEWKDREWDMIHAIIQYTSLNFSWTGSDVLPQGPRAKTILENLDANPDWHWGCGTISNAAIGLAQAHGIPARRVGGTSEYGYGSDITFEVFSTRWNRWIHVHPHGGQWIEDQTGPLGVRELHEYDIVGGIIAVWTTLPQGGGYYRVLDYPPLSFFPSNDSRAPSAPFVSTKFWSGYFWYMRVWYEWQANAPVIGARLNIVTHDFLNDNYAVPRPITSLDDPGLTYPLNNVEAGIVHFDSDSAMIALKHNLVDFVGYEHRVDGGAWSPLVVTNGEFDWTFTGSSILEIRGVGVSGSHSPDVVIRAYEFDEELISPCALGPGVTPTPLCESDLDLDGDGDVDLHDYSIVIQLF